MKPIAVKINPHRVCAAIAKIGYEPHSALMDIIDNSVAAHARNVTVHVRVRDGMLPTNKKSVESFLIVDDGRGMTNEEIQNALRLGSDDDYEPFSLSKYGMGLKSAGMSLGWRIEVVSKKNGTASNKYILDQELLKNLDDYTIFEDSLTADDIASFEEHVPGQSGTVVRISKVHSVQSAKSTSDKLRSRVGVVYYGFLAETNTEKRLTIKVDCQGSDPNPIAPFDILFRDVAERGFDPDKYTGKVPVIVFDKPWKIATADTPNGVDAKLEMAIFPKAKMASQALHFTDEERQLIREFKVGRENKGFFIYRNGRLIRWGDDIDGLIDKDDLGFRARLDISSEHDEVLQVDVSKQRLEFPEELRGRLETLVSIPVQNATSAFKRCDEILQEHANEEGKTTSEIAADFESEDPDETFEEDRKVPAQRLKRLKEQSERVLEQDNDATDASPEAGPKASSEDERFEAIRYSERMSSHLVWEAHVHPDHGEFVRINKNHPFYQTVLVNLQEGSPGRTAVETLIFITAVAELLTKTNYRDLTSEQLDELFAKFNMKLSSNLSSFTLKYASKFRDG